MTSEMGEQQPDLHADASVQVVHRHQRRPRDLARDRGREIPLFGPADGSALDVHLIELDPGGPAGHYHFHSRSENVYVVLEGSIEVRHAGGGVRLTVGDAIRFPPKVAHSAVVSGSEMAVLLEIYAPAEVDFVRLDEPAHVSPRS